MQSLISLKIVILSGLKLTNEVMSIIYHKIYLQTKIIDFMHLQFSKTFFKQF